MKEKVDRLIEVEERSIQLLKMKNAPYGAIQLHEFIIVYLKATKIIKEKRPNLTVIFDTYEIETYEEYLNFVKENENEIGEDRYYLGKLLTHEEFDCIREVF